MLENCANSVANEQNNIMIERKHSVLCALVMLPSHIWPHFSVIRLFFHFAVFRSLFFIHSFFVSFYIFSSVLFTLTANLLFIWCNRIIPTKYTHFSFFSFSPHIPNRANLQILCPFCALFSYSNCEFWLLFLLNLFEWKTFKHNNALTASSNCIRNWYERERKNWYIKKYDMKTFLNVALMSTEYIV